MKRLMIWTVSGMNRALFSATHLAVSVTLCYCCRIQAGKVDLKKTPAANKNKNSQLDTEVRQLLVEY